VDVNASPAGGDLVADLVWDEEIAKQLNVTTKTVENWEKRGLLPRKIRPGGPRCRSEVQKALSGKPFLQPDTRPIEPKRGRKP
jgi:hypothetical protein